MAAVSVRPNVSCTPLHWRHWHKQMFGRPLHVFSALSQQQHPYPSSDRAFCVPETCTPSPWCGGIMSKDAASSSLPAPLRAIVGVLTLALRAVQLVVRRRRHATQHSPRLAHKSGTPQVATGLIYFIFCQGTMLAKEQKLIKKVPAIVNQVRAGRTTRGWSAPAVITPALLCT